MKTQENKTLVELLAEIQTELIAPKNQRNKFGNYNYRSAEDIIEAVKPLVNSRGLILNISDDIVQLGDRYYIKSTSSIVDKDGNRIEAIGFAREGLTQSGMSEGQITGSTSSYARKYSLNGLFATDDTKDLDSEEYQAKGKSTETAKSSPSVPSNLPYLNQGTENYTKVEKAISEGKATIKDVKTKYKLSKAVEESITKLVK